MPHESVHAQCDLRRQDVQRERNACAQSAAPCLLHQPYAFLLDDFSGASLTALKPAQEAPGLAARLSATKETIGGFFSHVATAARHMGATKVTRAATTTTATAT